MTDLRTLADAFAELERRADVAMSTADPTKSEARLKAPPVRRRRTWASHGWLAPVAAAAAVVLGVVAAAAALAPGGGSGGGSGTPSGTHSGNQTITSATSAPTTQPAQAATSTVPRDSAELATRFQTVLGDTATFTVTDTGPGIVGSSAQAGAFLGGVLTASGVSGGYHLWFYAGRVMGECGYCTRTPLADGSELWVHRTPLEGPPGGLTVGVDFYRADGVVIRLYVSNARSPKGGDDQLASQPPLTEEQVIAILTSQRW